MKAKRLARVFLNLVCAFVALVAITALVGMFGPRIAHHKLLKNKAKEAKEYCETHHMNTRYCALVDFSVYSGMHRFFIWDFDKNRIVYAGPVCHGYGKGGWEIVKPKFSNKPGSYRSSLGKYRIGEASRTRQTGKHCYRIDGLEASNSNARRRGIVIHGTVPQYPLLPFPIPLSKRGPSTGCFTLSADGMNAIDGIMKKNTNVLLYAFCE